MVTYIFVGQLGEGKRDGVGEGRGRGRYSYLGGGCDHSAAMPILEMHLIGRFRSCLKCMKRNVIYYTV